MSFVSCQSWKTFQDLKPSSSKICLKLDCNLVTESLSMIHHAAEQNLTFCQKCSKDNNTLNAAFECLLPKILNGIAGYSDLGAVYMPLG